MRKVVSRRLSTLVVIRNCQLHLHFTFRGPLPVCLKVYSLKQVSNIKKERAHQCNSKEHTFRHTGKSQYPIRIENGI